MGSERVASALQALESVKTRWREEELAWRSETDELRTRVVELHQRLEVYIYIYIYNIYIYTHTHMSTHMSRGSRQILTSQGPSINTL
jgi:hypothetical protein